MVMQIFPPRSTNIEIPPVEVEIPPVDVNLQNIKFKQIFTFGPSNFSPAKTLVGNSSTESRLYLTGASVDSNIQNVANINSPSSWTYFLNISNGPYLINQYSNYGNYFFAYNVTSNFLRCQLLLDSTIVADAIIKNNDSSYDNHTKFYIPFNYNMYDETSCFFVNESVQLRVCRQGSINNEYSLVSVPLFRWIECEFT